MSQDKSSVAATIISKLYRAGRLLLFFVSWGYLYPHVLTEGMDLTKIQAEHEKRTW